MANHFTQFSEYLTIKNPAEEQWLKEQLGAVYLTGSKQILTEETPQLKASGESYEEMPRFHAEALQRGETQCELDFVGFSWNFEKDDEGMRLWISAEESGDVEQVAYFVQLFLKKFDPHGWWTLTWANTCSRPLVGQFSGGALVVTAQEISFLGTSRWMKTQQFALSLRQAQRR